MARILRSSDLCFSQINPRAACGCVCRIRNPLDTSNFDNFDNCDVEPPPVPASRLERHNELWDLWEWIEKVPTQ